jgi:hypothetical protein
VQIPAKEIKLKLDTTNRFNAARARELQEALKNKHFQSKLDKLLAVLEAAYQSHQQHEIVVQKQMLGLINLVDILPCLAEPRQGIPITWNVLRW